MEKNIKEENKVEDKGNGVQKGHSSYHSKSALHSWGNNSGNRVLSTHAYIFRYFTEIYH